MRVRPAALRELAKMLLRLHLERKVETLKRGWPEMPPWLFCSTGGTLLDVANVEKVFKAVLKAAKLPLHFTPHSLRHTFSSLLLQQGRARCTSSGSSGTPRSS